MKKKIEKSKPKPKPKPKPDPKPKTKPKLIPKPKSKILKDHYVPTTEFYSQVIDSMDNYSIFTLNKKMRINSWSKGSSKIFQYETDEVIGKHFDIIFTEKDKNNGIPKLEVETAVKKGRAVDNRWHMRKDGTKFYASGLVFPLIGLDEKQIGYVKILRDLTEYKNAEVLIKKRNAEIKKYVGELEILNANNQNLLDTLVIEKKRSDDLLLNILPYEIAEELKKYGTSEAKHYENVSVLFTDFVGFTKVSEKLSPKELVAELHHCFTAFDTILERNGLEKIKSIGDAYLAVCGLPIAIENHAEKTIQAAIEIVEFINKREAEGGKFNIRIGINSGPVTAGIIGVKKFAYDVWGDTVNTASRLEQHSLSGKINISDNTYQLVKNNFTCTHRGKIEAKNKGKIDMYFVEGEI